MASKDQLVVYHQFSNDRLESPAGRTFQKYFLALDKYLKYYLFYSYSQGQISKEILAKKIV